MLDEIIKDRLRRELDRIRKRHPNFSVRSFAKTLNVPSSTLTDILNDSRKVTRKTALVLIDSLPFSSDERALLLPLLTKSNSNPRKKHLNQIDEATMAVVTEWYHFAILSLAKTTGFRWEDGWIARRLGLKTSVVKKAIGDLEVSGLIEPVSQGGFTVTMENAITSVDIPHELLKKTHVTNLKLAQSSLANHSAEEREFISVTMAMSRQKLPLAKAMIREFATRFMADLEEGDATEVYKLSVQCFPLSKNAAESRTDPSRKR